MTQLQLAQAATAVGLAGAAIAAALTPGLFPHAWLSATVFFAGWPLGSLGLLLIHQLTGGRWGDALTPALRLGVAATPLLIPLVLPVLLTAPALYPWAHPGAHPVNAWYLNPAFAMLRVAIYLVTWCSLAALTLGGRIAPFAAPALILLVLSTNFAAIDATLSLDPTFNSSVYGMLAAAGAILLALAMALALSTAPTARTQGDLGKLLLALVVLWAYLDFMQFLIVWQSDLVSEAPWMQARLHGPWGVVTAIIALDHFLLPLAVLLFPGLQRSARATTSVAILLVATEALRTLWTVLPAAPRFITWPDLACLLGVSGLAAIVALRRPSAEPRHA